MKAIKFEGDIDHKSIKELLLEIDKIGEENIILYFTSAGGSVADMRYLVDYINRNADRIELVCHWEMSSCAFDLLVMAKCKISIGDDCFSRIHLYSNDITYRYMGDKQGIDTFLMRDLGKKNFISLNEFKACGFSKAEISRLKKGQDITLGSARLKAVLGMIRLLRSK